MSEINSVDDIALYRDDALLRALVVGLALPAFKRLRARVARDGGAD